jgi:hypothetical protein
MKTKKMKTQILLDSFEILKDDFNKNMHEIRKIIEYFFKEDINTAFDMWDFLFSQNLITDSQDKSVVFNFISQILYLFDENDVTLSKKILKDFRKHSLIIDKVFVKSPYIIGSYGYYAVFLRALSRNGLEEDFAYFLDLLMQNKTPQIRGLYNINSDSIDAIIDEPNSFQTVILLATLNQLRPDISSENITQIIYSYFEKITNKLFRAKLNVAFANFF